MDAAAECEVRVRAHYYYAEDGTDQRADEFALWWTSDGSEPTGAGAADATVTMTFGDSRKIVDFEGRPFEITTGKYTTTAENNIYGTLETQFTEGKSYNMLWNGTTHAEELVGTYKSYASRYTTNMDELGWIDGYGTVRVTMTYGDSQKYVGIVKNMLQNMAMTSNASLPHFVNGNVNQGAAYWILDL